MPKVAGREGQRYAGPCEAGLEPKMSMEGNATWSDQKARNKVLADTFCIDLSREVIILPCLRGPMKCLIQDAC